MPTSPIVQLLLLFVATGLLFAFWKGGRAERAASVIVVANIVLGLVAGKFFGTSEGLVRLANDGLAAMALLFVTMRYGAPWMGGVMLFYAAQFALHSYYLVAGRPDDDYLHALVNNINFTGIIWCLIIGTAVAWRRRIIERRSATAAP